MHESRPANGHTAPQHRGPHTLPDDQRQQDPAERLEQLLRQQDVFAYGISHDLRAPLRAIETFSALLARNSGDRLDENVRDRPQRISDAAARMFSLSEQLLVL